MSSSGQINGDARQVTREEKLERIKNHPLYSIGVVSELLDVHPETIRTWERSGVVRPPQRRSGRRTFSENDFKRLEFVQRLTGEGLTVRAILYYLRLYPCWKIDDCAECVNRSEQTGYTKPCWREAGSYCRASSNENLCSNCQARVSPKTPEPKKTVPDALSQRQYAPKTPSNASSIRPPLRAEVAPDG